jgi:hypothetical protein
MIVLAGLKNRFDNYKSTNLLAFTNWSFIESTTMKWSEQCRYLIRNQTNALTAGDVQKYIDALDDKPGGFLEWIKIYW